MFVRLRFRSKKKTPLALPAPNSLSRSVFGSLAGGAQAKEMQASAVGNDAVGNGAVAVEERPQRRASEDAAESNRVSPRIKTYRTVDMRQAMMAARKELGENAILIDSRQIENPEGDERYEVTFGVIGGASAPLTNGTIRVAPDKPQPPKTAAPVIAMTDESDLTWAKEFGSLRKDIAGLQAMLARHYWSPASSGAQVRRSAGIRDLLVKQGLDADMAFDWAVALEDQMNADGFNTSEATTAMLARHLSSRIQSDASLGWDDSYGKAALFLGPPASGKTTVLIKIALEYGIKRGRLVEIYSLDKRKVELDHPAETVANMLNLPCRTFKSCSSLAAALEAPRNNTLVLVDTSGFGNGSVEQDRELADVVSSGDRADVHLVVPAVWNAKGIRRLVDRFEIFQPSRLLFTMLDQTCTFAPILAEGWRTRKRLSFVNDGPLASGEIRPASIELVLQKMEQAAKFE